MNVSEIMVKMIAYSEGNLHDINHFLKVHAYAEMIAECEAVSREVRQTAEIAAIVHDIACPLCREKYGNTNGKYQETEGIPLTRAFLADTGLSEAVAERVVYLVGHHHTPQAVDGPDYQILLEAGLSGECGRDGVFGGEYPQCRRETVPDGDREAAAAGNISGIIRTHRLLHL